MLSLSNIQINNRALDDFAQVIRSEFSDKRNSLEDRIFRILTPSYFRIGALDESTTKMLKEKIKLSIKEKKPITIIFGMGWGKNWHSYSAPNINWAEYFHL